MINSLIDNLTTWVKESLVSVIESSFNAMFNDVNERVGTIAIDVGMTPQSWDNNVYTMIRNLSETIIIPIAGMIIVYVLCYELITTITEKNNMHDIDTFLFYKYFFKAMIAVYLLSHVFDITMAIFDVGQFIVQQSSAVIIDETAIDVETMLDNLHDSLMDMELGELILLTLESIIMRFAMKIMSVIVMVIINIRMIEIYLHCSIAPVPFATFTNRELGSIGQNFTKALFALAFQGFFIMICVGIYSVLITGIDFSADIQGQLFTIGGYTVILCLSLSKSNNISKSIFGAH